MDRAGAVLADVFGFHAFRPGQEEIVATVLGGENVLAVLPTGAGKSLCYQLPALLRDGLTLVVSPLIALMRNQVAQLEGYGIAAACLNSTNTPEDNRRTVERLRDGSLRLLYAAPERLRLDGMVSLLRNCNVTLLAIDEAHCISQWGHDFRPDYLELGQLRGELGGVQTIALTATADAATRSDIAARLFDAPPRVFVHGFDRPNLRIDIRPKDLAADQLLRFIASHRGESGIVYCGSRRKTEDLAARFVREGYKAVAYHAGLEAAQRDAAQDRFLAEPGVIAVATVAFGMGIDKPDVRFVAHADMPKSIESWYQEIGRAGRDGQPAETLTLFGLDDLQFRRHQIEEAATPDAQKRVERRRLDALVALMESPRCYRQTLLAYFGEESQPCGNCGACSGGVETVDGTLPARKAMSAMLRTGERFGREHLISILRGEKTEAITRLGHDTLPTFGTGADMDRRDWSALFRQLYAAQLCEVDVAGHGNWLVTDAGRDVLFGRATFEMRRVQRPAGGRSRGRKAQAEAAPADAGLLADLKAYRSSLARERGVPAYVVFSDQSLIDMATRRPRTLAEFREVHGVGETKLKTYGPGFLERIAKFAG